MAPSTTPANGASAEPQAGNGDTRGAADENTPLLINRGEDAEPDFTQHARKWRRQRWTSCCLALLLVTLVVGLIGLFGGI